MNLYQAARMIDFSTAALVGSGGKTTALFQMARQMEPPVVVTATTHLGDWQAGLADRHLIVERPADLPRFSGMIEGVTLMTGPVGLEHRLKGMDQETIDRLRDLSQQLGFKLLIEADGSRQRPLKAPGPHEPAIPGWVDAVLVVCGLSGIGQPLAEAAVHRPELFAELCHKQRDEIITEDDLAQVLTYPTGGLKNIPEGARKILLLNQADDLSKINAGLRVATLVNRHYDAVLTASLSNQQILRVIEPAAGLILAAGGSRRFGQPKLLLNWQNKPLIRYPVEVGLAAGLDPIIVVTGAEDGEIRNALSGLPVQIVNNPNWQMGQGSSVGWGLRSLPRNIGSTLFLLGDQPLITPEIIQSLVQSHQETLAPVIAPRVNGQRTNPVLFDRETFPALLELSGDMGGRAIFNQYPPQYVDWDDNNLLFDIDTPADYDRLQRMV